MRWRNRRRKNFHERLSVAKINASFFSFFLTKDVVAVQNSHLSWGCKEQLNNICMDWVGRLFDAEKLSKELCVFQPFSFSSFTLSGIFLRKSCHEVFPELLLLLAISQGLHRPQPIHNVTGLAEVDLVQGVPANYEMIQIIP